MVLRALVCAVVPVLAGGCRGGPLHPGCCLPAQCVCLYSWWEVGDSLVAGHPRVLSRARVCMHTCPLEGFLPLAVLFWCGREGLHEPVPGCLALCRPFDVLVSCWAQLH